LLPSPVQEAALRDHCAHARYVWNLAVEQHRHVDAKSRESQARFVCTACGFACNADLNAARNIAAGHAVTARGGDGEARPVNREPQLLASLTGCE